MIQMELTYMKYQRVYPAFYQPRRVIFKILRGKPPARSAYRFRHRRSVSELTRKTGRYARIVLISRITLERVYAGNAHVLQDLKTGTAVAYLEKRIFFSL